jgi:2-polyprenyl-6-methoxyphenol hydroxylase-like FAD-dependent oxidoreductase
MAEALKALIVGAGPVGLLTAVELTRRGLSCRIIDKLPEPSDKSKALGIHARTLEMFETMGLVDAFLEKGVKVHAVNFLHGDTKLAHLSFDELETPFPFTLCIPQSVTESILSEALAKMSVPVDRSVELINIEQNEKEVVAILKHADGRKETQTANWVIGCDGAHSTTRHLLQFAFKGKAYDESFATADVHVHWNNPEDELFGYVAEDGVLVFFPLGNHRYRILASGPHHETGDKLTLEEMQETISKRGPKDVTISDPIWLTWFNLQRRSVEEYRKGRVLLCGDAAHIHSPALGQGMNTGMQDAFNLAWKLDLIESGAADRAFIESYQTERHPIGQALLHNTDAVTKVITLRNPVAQSIRNHLIPLLLNNDVVQKRLMKVVSMTALNYRHSPLVGEYRQPVEKVGPYDWLSLEHGPAPGDRAPDGTLETAAKTIRLFQLFEDTKYHLLFFACADDDGSASETLAKIRNGIVSPFSNHVVCHLISTGKSTSTPSTANGSVLHDENGSLHHRYGVSRQSLYLIRPDGYVGFRSQPADLEKLNQHITKVLHLAVNV